MNSCSPHKRMRTHHPFPLSTQPSYLTILHYLSHSLLYHHHLLHYLPILHHRSCCPRRRVVVVVAIVAQRPRPLQFHPHDFDAARTTGWTAGYGIIQPARRDNDSNGACMRPSAYYSPTDTETVSPRRKRVRQWECRVRLSAGTSIVSPDRHCCHLELVFVSAWGLDTESRHTTRDTTVVSALL
ncbi:hypothetical protein EX30DRAFT_221114 [Ascodesmis nigricans]|uniref:Uncharacterized protein n=1 Tax=Ascodesmis nigricans TaxID=341454 RepID=A0A4S2MZV6_9PEZI|nr:hypothetical protein EX30DRAFT_221114 [Ascodesmis nigricans]